MDAKYDGRCAECYEPIEVGERIGYIPTEKAALCARHAEERIGPDPEEAQAVADDWDE